MTGEVKTVAPDTSVFEVACIMRDEDIGSVPVAENDKLVGMVTDRDIVLRGVASGTSVEECTARDVMSQKILYVREDQDVEDVLQNMGDQQVRRMPVINSDMRLVGIVSLGDLSRKAKTKESGESLKEISQPTTGSKH
jgi:CBS domain-containing protein